MNSPVAEYAGFVEHPRYGKGPRFTGLDVAGSPDARVYCHWHSPPGVRVPNTAVVADASRQGKATLHVTHYFDAKRVCRRCGRPFLFFAEEQKHWYEELMFPLEADCLDCVPCRKDEQRLRAIRQNYDALLKKTARTQADTLELVEAGLFLVESVVFSAKLLPNLRGFLKPLLLDAKGPYYTRAHALLSAINGVVEK
ncbi:MAG TPA: zinc-ribbon domain containing protein [Burkholderiales bacterium]|jgi:hypothetical protein